MNTKKLVGLTIDQYKGLKPHFLLHKIQKFGVEFAEVTTAIFTEVDKVIKNIGRLALGLHLPILSSEGFDFSCVEKKAEIDQLIEKINRYWQPLKLQYVLSHPTEQHIFNPNYEVSEKFLFENLKKIKAPIVLENTFENDSFNFNQFLLRAETALQHQLHGICFDAPHAFISNHENWLDLLQQHYHKIKLIHLSDCTKEKDLHAPFGGEGELPVTKVLNYLQQRNYRGIVNLELLPRSLRELAPVFHSYLLVLKYLDQKKYISMRFRSYFFLPFLSRYFARKYPD